MLVIQGVLWLKQCPRCLASCIWIDQSPPSWKGRASEWGRDRTNSGKFLARRKQTSGWKQKQFSNLNVQMSFLGIFYNVGSEWIGCGEPDILHSHKLPGDPCAGLQTYRLWFRLWEWLCCLRAEFVVLWGFMWSCSCCIVGRDPWLWESALGGLLCTLLCSTVARVQGPSWRCSTTAFCGSPNEFGELWGSWGLFPHMCQRAII